MKSYKETPLEKALGDYLWSLQDQIDSLMEYTDLLGNHCQLTVWSEGTEEQDALNEFKSKGWLIVNGCNCICPTCKERILKLFTNEELGNELTHRNNNFTHKEKE